MRECQCARRGCLCTSRNLFVSVRRVQCCQLLILSFGQKTMQINHTYVRIHTMNAATIITVQTRLPALGPTMFACTNTHTHTHDSDKIAEREASAARPFKRYSFRYISGIICGVQLIISFVAFSFCHHMLRCILFSVCARVLVSQPYRCMAFVRLACLFFRFSFPIC